MSSRGLINMAVLLASGLVAFPVVAYLAGRRLVGPYGGSRGLASFLGDIYGDAADGAAPALVLLLAPVLVATIWIIRARFLKRYTTSPETPAI